MYVDRLTKSLITDADTTREDATLACISLRTFNKDELDGTAPIELGVAVAILWCQFVSLISSKFDIATIECNGCTVASKQRTTTSQQCLITNKSCGIFQCNCGSADPDKTFNSLDANLIEPDKLFAFAVSIFNEPEI